MSLEENKAIIRRFYDEMNREKLAVIDELVAPDYVAHDPSLPPDMREGRETFKRVVAMSREAFPGHQMTVEDLVAEGDRVATRLTFRGRHAGRMDGSLGTGVDVTFTGIGIYRIANGQVAEGWFSFDQLGMMRQIGEL